MLVSLLVISVAWKCSAQFINTDNDCDWSIWDTSDKAGVRAVTTRCSTGTISWHHPYGAVRIQSGHLDPFRLCFISRTFAAKAIISLETINKSGNTVLQKIVVLKPLLFNIDNDNAKNKQQIEYFMGPLVNISSESSKRRRTNLLKKRKQIRSQLNRNFAYTHKNVPYDYEQIHNPHELWNYGDEVCLESPPDENITLFLEAEMDQRAPVIGHVILEYDIEPIRRMDRNDSMDECRPCDDEELLRALCSSDYVVQGSLLNVQHIREKNESILNLDLKKIYRQSLDLFHMDKNNDSGLENNIKRNKHMKKSTKWKRKRRRKLCKSCKIRRSLLELRNDSKFKSDNPYLNSGSVIAPYKCRIHGGEGNHIFMGHIRHRRAILKCAPRLEEMQKVLRHASNKGIHMCAMEL